MIPLQVKHLIQWVKDVFPSVQSSTRRQSVTDIFLKPKSGVYNDYTRHVRS